MIAEVKSLIMTRQKDGRCLKLVSSKATNMLLTLDLSIYVTKGLDGSKKGRCSGIKYLAGGLKGKTESKFKNR